MIILMNRYIIIIIIMLLTCLICKIFRIRFIRKRLKVTLIIWYILWGFVWRTKSFILAAYILTIWLILKHSLIINLCGCILILDVIRRVRTIWNILSFYKLISFIHIALFIFNHSLIEFFWDWRPCVAWNIFCCGFIYILELENIFC